MSIKTEYKAPQTVWQPDWSHAEQAQLVAAAQAGDARAQELIYRQFSKRVFNLAYRMVWHRETAQELMQECFIDVIRGIKSFRGDVPLYAWVRKVSINRCLQYLRKQKDVYLAEPQTIAELQSDHNASSQQQSNEFDVSKLLQRLTPKRRMIVWLYQVEGMTHKEIGESMQKSVSFSKMEYSRALLDLKAMVTTDVHSSQTLVDRQSNNKIAKQKNTTNRGTVATIKKCSM